MPLLRKLASLLVARRDRKNYERQKSIIAEIEREQDPEVKLIKQILIEIRGTFLGGMASSSAYLSFKENYYEKVVSAEEKAKVREALLQILRSPRYKLLDKVMVSHICADIVILEAISEIEKLIPTVKKKQIPLSSLQRSLDALRQGRSITEITYDILRQRGEL